MKEEQAAVKEAVKSVSALTAEIDSFLANTRSRLQASGQPAADLSGVQGKLSALMLSIQEAGCRVREAEPLLSAASKQQIEKYVHCLEELKQFMTALGHYAEARQVEIAAHSRELSNVKAWCDAVKLSSAE